MDERLIQKAIDQEVDRLCRLKSYELMQLVAHNKLVSVDDLEIEIGISVQDYDDHRNIGVHHESRTRSPFYKKYFGGLEIEFNQPRRLTDEEASSFYD